MSGVLERTQALPEGDAIALLSRQGIGTVPEPADRQAAAALRGA